MVAGVLRNKTGREGSLARRTAILFDNVCRYVMPWDMRRTTVFLTPLQIQKLERLAKKTGLKQSELIRRFIDAGLEKQ